CAADPAQPARPPEYSRESTQTPAPTGCAAAPTATRGAGLPETPGAAQKTFPGKAERITPAAATPDAAARTAPAIRRPPPPAPCSTKPGSVGAGAASELRSEPGSLVQLPPTQPPPRMAPSPWTLIPGSSCHAGVPKFRTSRTGSQAQSLPA